MSLPEHNPIRQAWLMVALLWIAAFLNYLDRMILITMRSSIKEAIPMTDAQFGLLTTVFLVAYGMLSPIQPESDHRLLAFRMVCGDLAHLPREHDQRGAFLPWPVGRLPSRLFPGCGRPPDGLSSG